ncbi:beta strand repeat-containing protein [Methylocucumis oryzae]|uniref:SbsA Ig-like domain-containing protein n=1 Tax=Methylocucumis oryzae TaxID=1632867 RepID=A0A0F3IGF8_9GAMM|nr:Ig-like domain-containing protein [Methylocucumis oryzae]KJV05885.1 hypothetical protein VZ94_14885 [Methylocucumis oryzae]
MAIPKITYMGVNATGTSEFSKISIPDLLLATGGYPDSAITEIEANHDLQIDELIYEDGLAIFGTKDGNSTMKATFSGLTVTSTENSYGKFVNLDSTHWLLLLTPAALDVMGQGGESIKLTSTLAGKDSSSITYVTVDTLAPTLFSSSPGNNDEEVAVDSNISLTYSENIKFSSASGTITLQSESGFGDIAISIDSTGAVTSGNATVSISGKTLTINPTDNLTTNDTYNVIVDAGLIEDNAGNDAAALDDDPLTPAEEVKFETTHIVSNIGVGANGNMDYIGKVDNGEYGVTLFGDDDGDVVGDQFATSVSNAGDVNGDGYDDIIIGSALADNPYSSSTGLAYVVFGGKNGLAIDVDDPDFEALNDLDGTNGGFIISSSSNATENLGRSVSSAGDLNGDGYADLLIGATGNLATGSTDSGRAFVVYGQKSGFANVDTSTFQFDSSNGFQLTNSDLVNVNMGFSVSTAGDLNGDGLADFIVGAPGGVLTAVAGKAYVIFGNEEGYANNSVQYHAANFTGELTGFSSGSLSPSTSSVVKFTSTTTKANVTDITVSDTSTNNVSAATTQGSASVTESAAVTFTDLSAGESVTVAGLTLTTDSDLTANQVATLFANRASGFHTTGFTFSGTQTTPVDAALGTSVSDAGDVNGDGYGDLIISMPFKGATLGGDATGESYVVFGGDSGWATSAAEIDAANGAKGFKLVGSDGDIVNLIPGDYSGWSVGSAGDFDGDGLSDLAVSSTNGLTTYVVFGKSTWQDTVDMTALVTTEGTLSATQGFTITDGLFGAAQGMGNFGFSVSSAGDVNGDGYDDLIIGEPGDINNPAQTDASAGAAYVIYGKGSGFSDIDLSASSLDGSNGFEIEGASAYEHLGNSVSGAGDLNGDGFDDLIVGASGADSTGFSGSLHNKLTSGDNTNTNQVTFTYTENGNLNPLAISDTSASGNISVVYTDGTASTPESFVVTFPALDAGEYVKIGSLTYTAGHSLTDIQVAELFDSLTAGYQGDNVTGNEGEAYVIYGSEHFGHKATHVGTAKADVLNGTTAANTFVSGRGNDLIFGKGGADVYNAGAGNDTIKISDLNFRLVDGGSGTDTLSLAMAGKTLTLASENISNIETIDLTGTGANSLKLTALDVLNMSDNSNKLTVKGNVGDKLDFEDTGWTDAGTSGIYDKYTNGEAVLLVGQAITVVDFA